MFVSRSPIPTAVLVAVVIVANIVIIAITETLYGMENFCGSGHTLTDLYFRRSIAAYCPYMTIGGLVIGVVGSVVSVRVFGCGEQFDKEGGSPQVPTQTREAATEQAMPRHQRD